MVKIKNFIDTPSQTAGPFLHIGCTPSITGINIFKVNWDQHLLKIFL